MFLLRGGGRRGRRGFLQLIILVVTNYMYIIAHILYLFILRILVHNTICISDYVRVVQQ